MIFVITFVSFVFKKQKIMKIKNIGHIVFTVADHFVFRRNLNFVIGI